MKSDERTLSERLRSAGLQVTAAQLAVLAAVQSGGRHLDTVEIADTVRKRLGVTADVDYVVRAPLA
jgi:Fe2+ or Zn2+ uptake regulation protein